MNRNTFVGFAAVAVLTAGVLYFMRSPPAKTTAGAKDVTKTNTGGLVTTPIKTSQVAAIQIPFADSLRAGVSAVRTRISSAFQHAGQNVLQPFGTDASAKAANASPLRPEYKVNALATKANVIALKGYR